MKLLLSLTVMKSEWNCCWHWVQWWTEWTCCWHWQWWKESEIVAVIDSLMKLVSAFFLVGWMLHSSRDQTLWCTNVECLSPPDFVMHKCWVPLSFRLCDVQMLNASFVQSSWCTNVHCLSPPDFVMHKRWMPLSFKLHDAQTLNASLLQTLWCPDVECLSPSDFVMHRRWIPLSSKLCDAQMLNTSLLQTLWCTNVECLSPPDFMMHKGLPVSSQAAVSVWPLSLNILIDSFGSPVCRGSFHCCQIYH